MSGIVTQPGMWARRRSQGPPGFPQILSSSTYNSGSSTLASHVVPMPAGVTTGDLLLCIFRLGGASQTVNTPSGWTLTGPDTQQRVFWKISDGSEGASQTFPSGIRRAVAAVYRISPGASVERAYEDKNTGVFPALAPSGGSKKYLWFAAMGQRDNASVNDITGISSGFTDLHYLETTPAAGASNLDDCLLRIAFIVSEASTLTPGNWTASAYNTTRKHTVAVSPT